METQQKHLDQLGMLQDEDNQEKAAPGLISQDRGTSAIWKDAALLKNTMSNKDQQKCSDDEDSASAPQKERLNTAAYQSSRHDNNYGVMQMPLTQGQQSEVDNKDSIAKERLHQGLSDDASVYQLQYGEEPFIRSSNHESVRSEKEARTENGCISVSEVPALNLAMEPKDGKKAVIQLKVNQNSQQLAQQLLTGTFNAHKVTKDAIIKQTEETGLEQPFPMTDRSS